MFKKILIANRGEIALRIIHACRELGIESAVVCSQADRNAQYTDQADQVICIGAASAKDSYLNIDAILIAAHACGAEAIHPGYGFLSENAEFARRVETAGFVFIGPSPESIETMGDKIKARQTMISAGVPCIPGTDGALSDSTSPIAEIAEKIGYPVIVKAGAGGGGRGMRVVKQASELQDAISITREEARSAFGNPALYMEKYLQAPRHIEIQVLCDTAGNAYWLGDRDCSLQRRHQKVMEEAPSPSIDRALIQALGAVCADACRKIQYRGAGTFEFLYENGEFYFIEMNTRLQVEHPVTEQTCGLDLVQNQIKVAAGENLPLVQADIPLNGHSIECRINAEDPDSFAPSSGTITKWLAPVIKGVRVDTHVSEGYMVSPYYDSLIAKLIVHADNRKSALELMQKALSQLVVEGIKTNIPMLRDIIEDDSVLKGGVDVHFLGNRHL